MLTLLFFRVYLYVNRCVCGYSVLETFCILCRIRCRPNFDVAVAQLRELRHRREPHPMAEAEGEEGVELGAVVLPNLRGR